MVDNVIGMLLGAELEKKETGDGLKGALEGYLIEGALKTLAPLAVTFAIGWGVQFLVRKAYQSVTGDEELKGPAKG